jgi:hypothetical protein
MLATLVTYRCASTGRTLEQQEFHDPGLIPCRRDLVTLKDSLNYRVDCRIYRTAQPYQYIVILKPAD